MYIYIINYIKKEKKAVSSPSLHRRVETFQEAQREDSPSRARRGGNPIGMLGRRDAISLLLRAARVLVASETSGRLRRKAESSRGTPRGERHPSLRCNSFRGVGVGVAGRGGECYRGRTACHGDNSDNRQRFRFYFCVGLLFLLLLRSHPTSPSLFFIIIFLRYFPPLSSWLPSPTPPF